MGILQARILEWVAVPSFRKLPDPGIESLSPEAPTLQAMNAHAYFYVVFILLLNFAIGIYVLEQF